MSRRKGYILTNRYVLPGPFYGTCTFADGEQVCTADRGECDVQPVYGDHIHDYGFLKFDPQAIKYMTTSSLQLRLESAQVGVEIKMIGNDAGEKLSVLSRVISRLNRNVPNHEDTYCDFNTNYLQASSAATGSSGNPVRRGLTPLQTLSCRYNDHYMPLDVC
jgi:S1-C subfamily serine protease